MALKNEKTIIPVTREALEAITDEAIALLLKKNHDYGNSWSRQGLAGVLVRLSDKFFRFENLAGGAEVLITDERIEDTLQDALAYSMLGLLYLRTQAFTEERKQSAAQRPFSCFRHSVLVCRNTLCAIWNDVVSALNLTLASPKDDAPVFDVRCKGASPDEKTG